LLEIKSTAGLDMYLVDTDVLSEARKAESGNAGVRAFFAAAIENGHDLYVSAVTIGELRQGIERIRYRGDASQATRLERWLCQLTNDFAERILSFDEETAHIWGWLRVPNAENPLDQQIAATALIHDLTVVSRNSAHFRPTGVQVLNPFT
jgi:predicted nucleic acid-binding protein